MLNETFFISIVFFGTLISFECCLNIFVLSDYIVYLLDGWKKRRKFSTEFHSKEYIENYPKLRYQKMNFEKTKLEVMLMGFRYCIFKGMLPILWGLVQGLGWAFIFLSSLENYADLKVLSNVVVTCIFALWVGMWLGVFFSPHKFKRTLYIQGITSFVFLIFDAIIHSSIRLEKIFSYFICCFGIYVVFRLFQIYIKKIIIYQHKFIYPTFIKYWYLREKEYKVTDEYSNSFNVRKNYKIEKWGFKYLPISIYIQEKTKKIWLSALEK